MRLPCSSVRALTFLLLVAACVACRRTALPKASVDAQRTNASAADTVPFTVEGDWILTEFHDSIRVHHRIGAYRRPAPIWSALLLHVGQDSIHRWGTILHSTQRRATGDTLLRTTDFAHLVLYADRQAHQLVAHWTDGGTPTRGGAVHYRHLEPSEAGLTERINADPVAFEANYHAYLFRTVFAGSYTGLDGAAGFVMASDGTLSDNTQWTRCDFHDYFGTFHPFPDDMDALYLTDARGTAHPFGWRFADDTLVLPPLGTDGDRYWPLAGRTRFLKHPASSAAK